MGWLADILGFFKRDPSMVKLITEKFRELHEITEKENRDLKQRIAELEMKVSHNIESIGKLELHEEDCHRLLIAERERTRELEEYIIFKLKEKPPPRKF